ncbi:unnamed protein product [Urochloa decumbens]|uniref:Uncharacterized protein n=1 Tax=Urochloa decumbens TaxID=240449 RepID=A0ABC8ZH97_9POAL
MDAAAATALIVACAGSSLPSKAEDLLTLAEKLGTAADRCGVPKTRLVAAADKLSRAEESTRLEAVLELGSAAAPPTRWGRRRPLWRARARGSATWWDSNWRSERIAGCSAMQGCALVASLTLLPYMGPDGVLKPNAYDLWYRQFVGVSFSLIWCLVSVSVPCLFVRSRVQYFYARLFSRIGMLAATLLVIFYCYWMLFPEWVGALWILSIDSALLHFGVFVWACTDGDM